MALASLAEEDLAEIIRLARKLRDYNDGRLGELTPEDASDLVHVGRVSPRPELMDKIAGLSDAARHELLALFYLGREGEPDDFGEVLSSTMPMPRWDLAGYLSEKSPVLGDDLERGLALLGQKQPGS